MEHDQRDRPDSRDADDVPAAPYDSEPIAGADAPSPIEPAGPDPTRDTTATPAPSEVESWPSEPGPESSWERPAASEPEWPTEPPSAGSGGADTWPTSPPRRDEISSSEPAWPSEPPAPTDATASDGWSTETSAEPTSPPPAEVEAFGGAGASAAGAGVAGAAHSVPDTEVGLGDSTQCPRCGTENRPGLAFCRNCGQRLVASGVASTVERPSAPEGTMACPRCGTHNRAGVAFCQNCGANLRGTSPGYVPPAAATETATAPAAAARRGAVLGPVVLLIGIAGMVTGYLLPFLYGTGSLYERAAASGGYGVAFWNGYPEVGSQLADQAYFGLAAPVPLLAALLLVLAVAGFACAAPGPLQAIGLVIALLWSVGLIILFLVVELAGNWGGDLVGVLRDLTPAGIILFLASLIVLIGTLTRFARS